jgi:hypothetical protein
VPHAYCLKRVVAGQHAGGDEDDADAEPGEHLEAAVPVRMLVVGGARRREHAGEDDRRREDVSRELDPARQDRGRARQDSHDERRARQQPVDSQPDAGDAKRRAMHAPILMRGGRLTRAAPAT